MKSGIFVKSGYRHAARAVLRDVDDFLDGFAFEPFLDVVGGESGGFNYFPCAVPQQGFLTPNFYPSSRAGTINEQVSTLDEERFPAYFPKP